MKKASLPFYIREDDPPAKRQILRAAMKLFSERGYAATSIRDIAKESGYTNPALSNILRAKRNWRYISSKPVTAACGPGVTRQLPQRTALATS